MARSERCLGNHSCRAQSLSLSDRLSSPPTDLSRPARTLINALVNKLTVLETHPVQYHAPVYRCLAQTLGVELRVIYGSDFSVRGYRDAEFHSHIAWDTDLLSGYEHLFLSTVERGSAANYDAVSGSGLKEAIHTCQSSALMCLGYWHPFDRAGLKMARQQRLPLLFRGETNDEANERSWWKRSLRDLWLRGLYARCHALLYVGQHSLRHYQRLGARPEQLFFSPYCVDARTFTPDDSALRYATRDRLGIPHAATTLLFSGKLSERKGVDLIPEAVHALPDSQRERIHLLFLGDGQLRPALQVQCQGLSCSFTGFQNQSQMSAHYLAADALILPSRQSETWGLVVNEAMLHGLPCIVSSRVGCQPDLVLPGDTGEVCRAGDAPSLTTALSRLLPRLRDAGLKSRCRQQVAGYSVEAAAQGIVQALATL